MDPDDDVLDGKRGAGGCPKLNEENDEEDRLCELVALGDIALDGGGGNGPTFKLDDDVSATGEESVPGLMLQGVLEDEGGRGKIVKTDDDVTEVEGLKLMPGDGEAGGGLTSGVDVALLDRGRDGAILVEVEPRIVVMLPPSWVNVKDVNGLAWFDGNHVDALKEPGKLVSAVTVVVGLPSMV